MSSGRLNEWMGAGRALCAEATAQVAAFYVDGGADAGTRYRRDGWGL